jgi:3-oxoacyl-[acyl-carrier-protein] synthase-3
MKSDNVWTVITGTGSYIPQRLVTNADFLGNEFFDPLGAPLAHGIENTIEKFEAITGISARRYVRHDLKTSDIAFYAARDAIATSGTDKENLDYIIVAHNFGDVDAGSRRSDFVPTLAARVKHLLEIRNPRTIAYDLPFGCAGWLQAVIQADWFVRSGDVRRVLVIGAETLSRVCDPHDRDSMIYADGAGACVLEGVQSETPVGIMAHSSRSDTYKHADLLRMDRSYNPDFTGSCLFLKMQGHKLYEYALRYVPTVVKECITRAGLTLGDISKVLIHQANAKMDDAILKRVYELFGTDPAPALVMPMTISWLGNSSVATLPTLLDLLLKEKLENQRLAPGQRIVLASVGAGMNICAAVYGIPGSS